MPTVVRRALASVSVGDVALAICFGAVLAGAVAAAHQVEPQDRAPDAVAYLLAATMAAAIAVARHRPRLVLAATVFLLQAWYALGYSAIGLALPLSPAIYFASAAGHWRWAAVAVGYFVLASLYWRGVEEQGELLGQLGVGTAVDVALLTSVIMLGETVRSRRALRKHAEREIAALSAAREQERREGIERERSRIARELHDILGHTLAAIGVQAAVAREALRDDPDAAEQALTTIRTTSAEAVDEVASTVRLLRNPEARGERFPTAGLERVDELVEGVRRSGVDVAVERTPARGLVVPAAVDTTAYRILQEALTNVVRHARARRVAVSITQAATGLQLEIVDDGRQPPSTADLARREGHGLRGMRERVAAIGGTISFGPAGQEGFRVVVNLPLDAR